MNRLRYIYACVFNFAVALVYDRYTAPDPDTTTPEGGDT